MNFLVHLFVSQHDEYLQIGNWMGDLIKNRHIHELPPGIQKGIMLHRAIDDFSDQHRSIKRGIRTIRSYQYKYSPVVLDIFYDYLLFQNWEEYTTIRFKHFTNNFYDRLMRWSPVYPIHVQKRAVSMAKHKFLEAYISKEGLKDVFRRVGERAKFDNRMNHAVDDLLALQQELDGDFREFFPDLLEFSRSYSKKLL